MAQVEKNIILPGARGKIGDMFVIRQRGGKTYLSIAPGKRKTEPSEKQKKQQSRFQQAVAYAKTQIADTDSKAEYSQKIVGGGTAFNVAIADFMNAPEIHEINISGYNGEINDIIVITATDDFRVESVEISIFNNDDELIESGEAIKNINEIEWIYTVKHTNSVLKGTKIIAKAYDKPGNNTEKEQTVL